MHLLSLEFASNRFQELCFGAAKAKLQGNCFLHTTVFYIQTNEGAGRKIFRDGGRGTKQSWVKMKKDRHRLCESGVSL